MINAPLWRAYWAVYIIIAASVLGTLLFLSAAARNFILAEQYTSQYLLVSPFMHAGFTHLFLNIMGLHYIGGRMLLPFIGNRRFCWLFALSAFGATMINNLFAAAPAVGISAAVLGMLSCALYPLGRMPVKLLLIHDLFRLRPFALWKVAAFAVLLDVCGIIFGWGFFAHWAHLAGFAIGGIFGYVIFRLPHRRTSAREQNSQNAWRH